VFEWDPRKAEANAAKHGVTFDDAVTVFLDPDALDGPDLQHSSPLVYGPTQRFGTVRRSKRCGDATADEG
jgi:uncharacterized DUF497 family protein